jgi:tricorn protease-like protein
MSDIHDTLQRESERYTIRHGALDRMTRRRDRKRRNERFAALVVGLAIAIGIVVVGSAMLRSAHEPKPGNKHHSMVREGEVLEIGDDGATLVATDTITKVQRIVACADCPLLSEFALSARGEWIAYNTAVGGNCNPGEGLWVVGEQRPPILATSACGGPVSNSAWSPTSEVLAFADLRGKVSELVLLDPSTGERTAIVTNLPWISALAWAPGGTQLAFAGGPSSGIRVVDVENGASTSIAPASKRIDGMAWSPDGIRLVFDESVGERTRIRVVNVDGSDDRIIEEGPITSGPGAPAWSPDGTRIAYVTTPREEGRCCSFEVWVIGADGSDATRLFHSGCCLQDWHGPVWSPDGSHIAFLDLHELDDYPGIWHAVASDGTGPPELIDEVVAESWAQGR